MATTSAETSKARLREAALARRDALPAGERQGAAEIVAARAFPLPIRPGVIISGYMPLKSEFNPLPLMRKLAATGAALALPVIAGRGKPLIMRAYQFGQELESGVWGIREPKADAPEVAPDILLVPLAAFDRSGGRIGYGAGYYDMTINRLRRVRSIVAIGLAYAVQELPAVPITQHDARLDLVLTERDVIDCRGT
jgi:5-formyltetrahydrofolate cyclo-ligase